MRKLATIFAGVLVVLLLAPGAFCRLVIPVDKPQVGLMPVGIPDFQMQGAADGGKLAAILRNDLFVTGLFKIVVPAPRSSPRVSGEPDFDAWSKLGAQTLVTGTVSFTGDDIVFEGRLYNVALRKLEMGKRLKARLSDHRLVIHRFADRVMEKLTQAPGCFSSQIAFVGTSKPGEVFVMDFDGYNVHQVTRTGVINLAPRWAPDGGGILFTSYVRGTPDLWFQPLYSGQPRVVSARKGLNTAGRFSPDGRVIAASLSLQAIPHIFLLTPDGNIIKRLTEGMGNAISPTWSPDGSKIAYVSDQAGSPHIYTIPAAGGQPRRVTFQTNYNTDPDWSPTGELLAITAKIGGRFQICTMTPDGGDLRVLTDKGENQTPTWSPDGRMMAFSSDRDGTTKIYIMDSNGEIQAPVSPMGGKAPAWSRSPR